MFVLFFRLASSSEPVGWHDGAGDIPTGAVVRERGSAGGVERHRRGPRAGAVSNDETPRASTRGLGYMEEEMTTSQFLRAVSYLYGPKDN